MNYDNQKEKEKEKVQYTRSKVKNLKGREKGRENGGVNGCTHTRDQSQTCLATRPARSRLLTSRTQREEEREMVE